jgi:hypothetical protein
MTGISIRQELKALLGSRARPVNEAENLTAIIDPIV